MTKRQGFTLIELIVVLGIIAVLGGTVMGTARGMQRRTLQTASLTLQVDLRYAQRMALVEGRRWRVQFDQLNNRYTIRAMSGPPAETRTVYLPQGVEIYFLNAPNARVEYLPRGTISSAFSVILRKGPYIQTSTATVGAGRIAVRDIERLN